MTRNDILQERAEYPGKELNRFSMIGAHLEQVNRSLQSEINECRRMNRELRDSLRKKNALLKEIHHRVKNNLQIVASLLTLQEEKCHDPGLIDTLQESRSRVVTIAKLHEALCLTGECLDFEQYVCRIVGYLARIHDRDDIDFIITTRDITPEEDKVLPVALIINELVTNALKYAFPRGKTGTITIDLRISEGKKHILTISDNGEGCAPGNHQGDTSSLGLHLVQNMVRQLEGTLQLTMGEGTAVTVTFIQE